MTINPYGRGILQKANILLLSTFPEYFIPESVLKNVLLKLREVKDDTETLLNDLMERNGKSIEFMKTNRDAETGVLDFVAWCFKGSKDVVLRCTEPVFWDATHNTTRYEYKLSSFNAIDSEGKSRCVMMCLMLRERTEDLILFLNCWKEAFNTLLPSVFCTDEDSAMGSALMSLPRCDHVSHMLCCYHIFDTNVKKKVQQALLHGASSWPQFRRGLSVCREAVTEEEFHSQWNQLLELHLKRSNRTKNARNYMQNHIYSQRTQWAVAYNLE